MSVLSVYSAISSDDYQQASQCGDSWLSQGFLSREYLQSWKSHKNNDLLIARVYKEESKPSEMAGYLMLEHVPEKKMSVIKSLAVWPKFRRMGVASALLRRAINDTIHDTESQKIYLSVHVENKAAFDCYRKFNFQVERFLENFYNYSVTKEARTQHAFHMARIIDDKERQELFQNEKKTMSQVESESRFEYKLQYRFEPADCLDQEDGADVERRLLNEHNGTQSSENCSVLYFSSRDDAQRFFRDFHDEMGPSMTYQSHEAGTVFLDPTFYPHRPETGDDPNDPLQGQRRLAHPYRGDMERAMQRIKGSGGKEILAYVQANWNAREQHVAPVSSDDPTLVADCEASAAFKAKRATLQEHGIRNVATWHIAAAGVLDAEGKQTDAVKDKDHDAIRNAREIDQADCVITFVNDESRLSGAQALIGYAVGSKKPVFVVLENRTKHLGHFFYHPMVKLFDSIDELVKFIRN